jgi:hypothetical protein
MSTTAVEETQEEDEKEDESEEDDKKIQVHRGSKRGSPLMTVEDRSVAGIDLSVYLAYVKAAGGYWVFPWIIFALILSMGANIMTSQWLAWWTSNQFHFVMGKYVSLFIRSI